MIRHADPKVVSSVVFVSHSELKRETGAGKFHVIRFVKLNCFFLSDIDSIVTIVEMFGFMILAMIWYRRLEGNVDKDQLYDIMSKRYNRLRDTHGKDSAQLTLQDQMERESLAGSGSPSSTELALDTPCGNGVIPHDGQTMDRISNSSKKDLLLPNGNCVNELATEETDGFDENSGPVQALWLHRGSEGKFVPTTVSRPKRWSDNEFRINWTILPEVTDRETDV